MPPEGEFWDFGTKEYYKKNIYKLIEEINNKKSSHLGNFLVGKGLLDEGKVGEVSYGTSKSGRVDFSSGFDQPSEKDSNEIGIVIKAGEEIYCV